SYSGKATFYNPSVGLTSCGGQYSDDDNILALNAGMMTAKWSANPNNNPLCGRKIELMHNGKTVQATIEDTCPGCSGPYSVDLSPGLFNKLANPEEQVMNSFTVDWKF
ncbi:hypothetical protein K437DRAFT_212871, partial [Tilletiaria anomala UBC 951]